MVGFLKRLLGLGPGQIPDDRPVLYAEPYEANPDPKRGNLTWRVRLVTPDGKRVMNQAEFNTTKTVAVQLALLVSNSRIALRIPDDHV